MSRFLLLSNDGAGLPLAWKLKQQGHQIAVWIEEAKAKHLYDGLLKKVDTWKDGLTSDPIVIFDSVGIGIPADERPESETEWSQSDPLSEQIARKGFRVFGGNKLADRMEFDRTWGANLAKEAGLLVPETHEFDNFEDAIDLVEDTKKRYILKPHGNQAVFSNYPAQGWEDMVAWLEHLRDNDEFKGVSLELQEFISGQQLSCEGWWNGTEFVGINHTFEHKPLMDKDLGPFTGETGSLIYWTPKGEADQQYDQTLKKLTPVMKKFGYPPAPLDVNCIVNEKGAHFLEFTARFGYPALYSALMSVDNDWGEVIENMVDGIFQGFDVHKSPWHLCSRVWIPQWPYGTTDPKFAHAPFFQLVKPEDMEYVNLVDVEFDGERLLSGGTDGELMCVTSEGNSIQEARGILYQRLNDLYLYPMAWRTDLGLAAIDSITALKRWGFYVPASQ